MNTTTKAGFLASHHLMLSERLKDAKGELNAFDYRKAIDQDGIEAADLQLSRVASAVSEAQSDLAVFYDESGTTAQDFE